MSEVDWDRYAETYRQIERDSAIPELVARVMHGQRGSVIDVGCGEGDLLTRLSERFPDWELTGFEVSAFRAEVAQRRGHRVLVDAGGDVPAGQYDLVVSAHVIEHVEDDVDHARRLAALVRPGGHVYVETPLKLPGGWYFRRSDTAGWVLDPTHLREYRSQQALCAVLRTAGLDVAGVTVQPLRFPLSAAVALVGRALRRPGLGGGAAPRLSVPIPRYRIVSVLCTKPG